MDCITPVRFSVGGADKGATECEGSMGDQLTVLLSQKVTYLFCDWLNIDSKVLIGRVRQATRDVVKSEV